MYDFTIFEQEIIETLPVFPIGSYLRTGMTGSIVTMMSIGSTPDSIDNPVYFQCLNGVHSNQCPIANDQNAK